MSVDELWANISKHDTADEMMFFNTKVVSGAFLNSCQLQNAHAYVVLGAVQLSNGDRLVKVRNPWGLERYICDYNDESALWTPELRREAGATPEAVNEGIFFMRIEDFYEQGQSTIVSYDTNGWYDDHFLMLNDKTGQNGKWSWCGPTCTRHTVTVTSDVAQDLIVTAHTWDERTYPQECLKRNKVHSIYREGNNVVDMFRNGAHQMKPVAYRAGESKSYILEFDWDREGVTPDWSVTVQAKNGSVSVKHQNGLSSDSLPYIEKKERSTQISTPTATQTTLTKSPTTSVVSSVT